MDQARWERIEELSHEALARDEKERDAWLRSACGGDETLVREVESLIQHDSRARQFLRTGALADVIDAKTETMSVDLVGRQLGPYNILALIGSGGMGKVYRARDTRLGRTVAIKVLASPTATSEARRRFEREAGTVGALNHPNVLSVYDIGDDEGIAYIVSELLQGENLRQKLQAGKLPPRRARDYATQIAQGLAAAHHEGVIHRDLKPENVFVSRDGRIKILDFGIAIRALAEAGSSTTRQGATALTGAGMVIGTVSYMSPEQVRGEPLDHRTEVFWFGAVLYQMLAGRRVFERETTAETMVAVLKSEPPPLPQEDLDAGSRALALVALKCLEKDPKQRFQSTSDLAYALDLLGREVTQPTVAAGGPRRLRAWRPLVSGFAAVSAVALASAFVFGRGTRQADFKQLTFQEGAVIQARFVPPSDAIAYTAGWDNGAAATYLQRTDGTPPQIMQLPRSELVGISHRGELAIKVAASHRLALVPLAGGAPKDVKDNVTDADWLPDDSDLAVVVRETAVAASNSR